MKTLALFAALMLAACGSKSSTQTTTPTGGGDAKPLPDVPFEQLDHDQRIQFMKEKVVPTMAPLFQKHDPEEFADFGCKTCHGAGAEKGEFHMPNAALPKLFGPSMDQYKQEDVEWMSKEIKPAMAALLKEPEMTQDNPKGFGCLECHEAEAK